MLDLFNFAVAIVPAGLQKFFSNAAGERMDTVFDLVSVAIFLVVIAAFVFLTDREPRTISRLLLPCVAVAVANQVGNAGYGWLALAIFVAAAIDTALVVRSHPA